MRELLDAPSQRTIKILETLVKHEGWITFAELSAEVNASNRTIAADVSELKKHWGQKLNIEVTKKSGVRLNNQSISNIGLVCMDLFNQSVALQWLKELLFHPNQTVAFYEKKLFVSQSTLSRLLPKINRFLSGRGMTIQCKNNLYQFLAKDEQYLRDFSASFLLELYGLNLQNYEIAVDLKTLYHLILSALEKNLDALSLAFLLKDDISIVYNMMFYLISLVRENQGYTIDSDYPVEHEIDTQDLTSIQKEFANLHINNMRPIHQYIYNQFCGWKSHIEKAFVASAAETFLKDILDAFSISPNEDKLNLMRFILESYYLKAKLRPYKTSVLFDRIYYFSCSLRQTNPTLHQILYENAEIFLQNVNLAISSGANDIIFWLLLICPELYQYSRPKRALLIDDLGRLHAEFLAKVLSATFNMGNSTLLQIDIASYPDILTSKTLENYDMLITTMPNLPVTHRQVFLTNDSPSHNDLFAIYKAVMHGAMEEPS